ncbi:copper chaperone CopZ [Spirosoma lacussanchae]|uniref:heavy-metal-associated domain-containing protein n=1 Tax=Spirosoma lacussanchae TaxID=1884249 RepID=UPI0011095462|nr:heavy-metal-associated domain-containing protein [Spirosoma lacussanchae]
METLNFKTNIKCSGCVTAVTPFLNGIPSIAHVDGWNVDTASPDKILTVQTTDNRIGEEIQQAVQQAGYRAEPIERP